MSNTLCIGIDDNAVMGKFNRGEHIELEVTVHWIGAQRFMEVKEKVTAIIVAAGQGKRMEENINKQYILLRDKPIIAYTLEVFEKTDMVDQIILVVGKNEIDFCKKEIVHKYDFKKISKVIEGGKERKDSVYAGLLLVNSQCNIVIVHDGARPFITREIIEESVKGAILWGGVAAAVPLKDTIKKVNKQMEIVKTLNRENLWAVQTPQTFQLTLLKEAYNKQTSDKCTITDDAMLVEELGCKVKIIKGSYENIKITTPEDLNIAEEILKRRELK